MALGLALCPTSSSTSSARGRARSVPVVALVLRHVGAVQLPGAVADAHPELRVLLAASGKGEDV